MDLTAFLNLLLRRGWIALVLGLAAALAAAAYVRTLDEVYEGVTRVALQAARPADLGQTEAVKQSMRSYKEDITTHDMARAVAVRLGDDWLAANGLDADALQGMVSTEVDTHVYEIRVKARHPDPAVAAKVSEQFADAFIDRRETAEQQLDLRDRILATRRDTLDPQRVWPRRKLMVGAAGVLGVALGGLLILALEYVESGVVRGPRDLAKLGGLPLLGTVPPTAGARRRAGALRRGAGQLGRGLADAARLGWPIIALAALGGGVALLFSGLQPDVYRARTRIAIEPARGSDWGSTQGILNTMTSFSEDIKTQRMAQEVNARLKLDRPIDSLLASDVLQVSPEPEVYEIHIDVLDPDPDVAAAISRGWARLFVERRTTANQRLDMRDRILARVRDETTVEHWTPRRAANTLAGAVLGGLVGAGAVLALAGLRRGRLQDGRQAAAAAEAPLLGLIPPASHRRPRASAPGTG